MPDNRHVPRGTGGKDVPDGKNFRQASATQAAPACAPGHKTAEGQQGRSDPEVCTHERPRARPRIARMRVWRAGARAALAGT
jgi:hypothetical protein